MEPQVADETLIRLSGAVGEQGARLTAIEDSLGRVESELHQLRALVLPKRLYKISLAAGGGGGVLLAALAALARLLLT